MEDTEFPCLAFEFDEVINNSSVKDIFSSSSLYKLESILLQWILENNHSSSEGSCGDHQKSQDEKEKQQQKPQQSIDQLKYKLILSLQGTSDSSPSCSLQLEDQHQIDQSSFDVQSLMEKVSSFKQRIQEFSLHPFSSQITNESSLPNLFQSFDSWLESDCYLLLEEIGMKKTILRVIQKRLQEKNKSLSQSLQIIFQSLTKYLSPPLSPSNNANAELISACKRELPEMGREELTRLLIGLEMLSLGFGIIQIPQWWIDQEQMKPMEERNLMSINNGSEQVAQWMQRNLFPSIEPQLSEDDQKEIFSFVIDSKMFSGCQTYYFLPCVTFRDEHRQMITENFIVQKQLLFKDLEKQLVIIGNSDYDPEKEEENIHFFDPISRIQRKLSNQVGTWSSSSSLSPSLCFLQRDRKSDNETQSTKMTLKIRSIIDEIKEIQRQCKCNQEDDVSIQKRIVSNLPPLRECAWDILRSFCGQLKVGDKRIDISHLSNKEIGKIPKEIKSLNQKDLEWIHLKKSQLNPLIQRLRLIFKHKKREIGLQIEETSPEQLVSLLSKISRISSSSSTLIISKLSLVNNHIISIPQEIHQIVTLQTLNLHFNQITSLPVEISLLSSLEMLDLTSNQLTFLPKEIGLLSCLQSLELGENQLTLLPEEICHLSNLRVLNLRSNQVRSLPSQIGRLTNLQKMNISSNQIKSLPQEIGQLVNLQTLDLYSNQLTSLPSQIGLLMNLQTLNLHSNQLRLLPEEIGQLVGLKKMCLYRNQLKSLPVEIGLMVNLQSLYLSSNHLTSVPQEIGLLTNLQSLNLSYNRLLSLPEDVGLLKNLQTLNLRSNQLMSLPAQINQLLSLTFFDIRENSVEFGSWSKLKVLRNFYS